MTKELIDLARLVDPTQLIANGEQPWTFLAFPRIIVDRDGVPADVEARAYIAAVQSQGVPVGIWVDTPVEGVAYAFVGPAHIRMLCDAIDLLQKSGRYSEHYAEQLTNRLLGVQDHSEHQRESE